MKREEWMEYLEPDTEDLMEAEALLWETGKKSGKKRLTKKKWLVLLAACMLMAALGIGAAAGGKRQSEWFSSYFQTTDERTQELLERMQAGAGAAAKDAGYTIEVTEAVSDGREVYAVLTVTAPKGAALDAEGYGLTVNPYFWKEGKGGGRIMPGAGGGSTNEIDRPAQNQVRFLMNWQFEKMEEKQLLLEVTQITAFEEEESRTLAEGEWTLLVDIPKGEVKTKRQLTKIQAMEETYYVYKVEAAATGVHISAVKRVRFSTLLKTAQYLIGQRDALPAGWGKESFFALPVTIEYQDGTAEVISAPDSAYGRTFFLGETVRYGDNRLRAPEEIAGIRLGDIVLWTE